MKPRLIIIEGADNIGKTTLAMKLAQTLKFKYNHMDNPGNPVEGENQCFQLIASLHEDTVSDRGFLGEFVYGPLWRDYTPGYMDKLLMLAETREINMMTILMHTTSEGMKMMPQENPHKILKDHVLVSTKFHEQFENIWYGRKYVLHVDPHNMGNVYTLAMAMVSSWFHGLLIQEKEGG